MHCSHAALSSADTMTRHSCWVDTARYSKIADSSKSYIITQYGLSCFEKTGVCGVLGRVCGCAEHPGQVKSSCRMLRLCSHLGHVAHWLRFFLAGPSCLALVSPLMSSPVCTPSCVARPLPALTDAPTPSCLTFQLLQRPLPRSQQLRGLDLQLFCLPTATRQVLQEVRVLGVCGWLGAETMLCCKLHMCSVSPAVGKFCWWY